MYLPIKYVQPGLGYFQPMDARLQESEFYPPPYDADSPIGLSGWSDSLTEDSVIGGVPNWALLGAGAVALVFLLGRKGKGEARRVARTKYESELARINKEYTVGGKARRAARRIPRVRVTTA